MNVYDQISSNKRKSYILIIGFFIIIIILGYIIGILFANGIFGIIASLIIAVIMVLFSYFAGDKLILSMSGAKEVKKEDDPFLINTVEGLSIGSGLQMPKVYMIKENSINAFATGRDPKHASITVTSGMREKLNRQEIEAVLSHEISHIKNFDVRLMMLVAILVGVIALLSDFLLRSFFWAPKERNQKGSGGILLVLVLVGLVLAILSPLIANLIKSAVSRKREYLADTDGALLCKNPRALASALKKIRDDKDKLVDTANKATAHLYIENPLRKIGGSMNNLFSTHPPINERIKILESM